MNAYKIEGIKCESCVAKITTVMNQAGYSDAQVTLKPPLVKLTSTSTTRDKLQEIISKAGNYKVVNTSEATTASHDADHQSGSDERLTPLFVILSYIIGGTLLRASISNDFSFTTLMNNFMGGFFVVFSLFKLLNLSGFADAYQTYDIIAARSRHYGLAYPFIELLLGITYLTSFAPLVTNVVTLIIMLIGSVGVLQALRSKRKFQCACLGTALKLPMTKVTLVEDITMALMALVMLIHQI